MSALVVLGLVGWPLGTAAVAWTLVCTRAGASRRELIARACHELRGPITAARLGVALALRGGEMSTAVLRAIDLELSRAALALEDLGVGGAGAAGRVGGAGGSGGGRRAASVRAGRLGRVERVDVPQLLEDCVAAARAGAREVGATVAVEWSGADRVVWGDRVRLAQATRNLIANAIEHGGGEVHVRGRSDAGMVRIEVTDTGHGLPAPVAELVRRPRAGRGTRGRGLAIAAGIAERHGGRLAAAPSNRGARLVLEIPVAADPGRAAGGE